MTEESKTIIDTTSYLTPNFKSNVGQPPKTLAEQRPINYVGTNKYDKQLTPRENIRILIRLFQNPHAEGVLWCPTYLDYVHSHSRGSNTFVTDNLYETLNDCEIWIEDKVNTAVEDEFRDARAQQVLSDEQQNQLKEVTLRLVRNTYAGTINLNKLMDPYNYEEYQKPPEGETPKPFTYVGPFKTKIPNQQPYNIPAPETFAHNPSLHIVDLNPPTDDKIFRPGLFNIRYYQAEHKAPEFETKDASDVRLFLRYIAYHLFECHENPVEKLISKMIKIKNGKRNHKKDGFAAIIDPKQSLADTEFELDYRTDNDSNYSTNKDQCGPVGTPILYVSKPKPEGKIAEIDSIRGSPVGGEIHRGNGWRVMLKAFIWNKLTRAAENLYECLTIEPPGWDFNAPLDMIHVGNVISQQLFQRLGTDIFHGMLAYADIKAIAHAGSSKLACYGQLCKLRNNPLLPNKAYLATLVYDTMGLPRLRFVEEAQAQFLDLRYSDKVWADEYMRALLLYKEDMEKADQEVSDESLLDKFWIELTHAHRVLRNSSDFYELKLYELVKTHSHLNIHPRKTSHIDDEILTALSSLDSLHTYLISIRTTAETEGFSRKQAPQQWTRTPVSDERIAGIRSRLQVHKNEVEEQQQEEVMVMTREQRKDKYYVNKSKQYHTDYKKAKDSNRSKQNFRERMQNRGPRSTPPKRTVPDNGYYNSKPKFSSSNPFENSDKAYRPPPRRPFTPPAREPFGSNFPKRHTNVLKIHEELLESLDPESKEAALARRSLQEMMAMKVEANPEPNRYHDPYRDLYEEEHKSHYQVKTAPQSHDQYDQHFDQDVDHEAMEIYEAICRDYPDPEERDAQLEAYLEYSSSQHELRMLGGGDFQSIEYEPSQLISHSLYQTIADDIVPTNIIKALVDTGCSICCNPARKRPPIPGTCHKLRVPLRLHQGKGHMEFQYIGCVPRVVETNDVNYVITTLAVMTNFDGDADIISARSLSTLGLGTCMTPCHPITKLKTRDDNLYNHDGKVQIRLEPKRNGLPYIKCTTVFDRSKPFIDVFTGTDYKIKSACERAMAAFGYYFVGPNAGIPFDPPADFDFGLNTMSIEDHIIEQPLFPRIGGIEYHSSDEQQDTMFSTYADQQLAIHRLRSEYVAMTQTQEQGTSVLDTPFVPPSDFTQASPTEQDLQRGL